MIFTPEELKEVHWAIEVATDMLNDKIRTVRNNMRMEPTPRLAQKLKDLTALCDKMREARGVEVWEIEDETP